MKFSAPILFVSLLSVGLVAASPAEILSEEQRLGNMVDSLINKTISMVISSLPDPLMIDNKHFNLTVSGLSTGDADISSLIATGFHKIAASEIDSDLFHFKFNATINVPQLSISTKYDADVVLAKLLPLYGNGKLGLDVEDVQLKMSAHYKLTPLSIYNATLNFSMEKALFDVRGLLNNDALSSLVEEVLNDNVADFIKKHNDLVDRVLSEVVNSIFDHKNETIALTVVDEELAAYEKKFASLSLE